MAFVRTTPSLKGLTVFATATVAGSLFSSGGPEPSAIADSNWAPLNLA
jgi:hypothetical protein